MILRICFYSSLILLSSIDILEQKIPNSYLYFLFIFIFTNLISLDYFSLPGRLIISLAIASILFVIRYLTKGLGMGDVKLVFVTAFATSFFETIVSLLIACLIASICFIILKVRNHEIKKIPFVPFISTGYFVTSFLLRETV